MKPWLDKGIFTEQEANDIFDILVVQAGAPERMRKDFVFHHTRPFRLSSEYRFQGDLGFGGKFRVDNRGQCHVDYYPEDHTEGKAAVVREVNRDLERFTPNDAKKGQGSLL